LSLPTKSWYVSSPFTRRSTSPETMYCDSPYCSIWLISKAGSRGAISSLNDADVRMMRKLS